MFVQLKIRPQRITDAKAFFEILQQKSMRSFSTRPKTLKDELNYLKQNTKKRKNNLEYNFTITLDGKLVGGCGLKIDQDRKFIGEIGYFVSEEHRGKGIATKAVKLLENFAFNKKKLKRIIIIMSPKNKASKRVAEKSSYQKEGLMRCAYESNNKFHDAYMFAKVR